MKEYITRSDKDKSVKAETAFPVPEDQIDERDPSTWPYLRIGEQDRKKILINNVITRFNELGHYIEELEKELKK